MFASKSHAEATALSLQKMTSHLGRSPFSGIVFSSLKGNGSEEETHNINADGFAR